MLSSRQATRFLTCLSAVLALLASPLLLGKPPGGGGGGPAFALTELDGADRSPIFEGRQSAATDVNFSVVSEETYVVGDTQVVDQPEAPDDTTGAKACYWGPAGGGPIELPNMLESLVNYPADINQTLPAFWAYFPEGEARAINDFGRVVGISQRFVDYQRDQSGGPALDQNGNVIPVSISRAVYWDIPHPLPLELPIEPPSEWNVTNLDDVNSYAYDINNNGWITGRLVLEQDPFPNLVQFVLWIPNETNYVQHNVSNIAAYVINDEGIIAGSNNGEAAVATTSLDGGALTVDAPVVLGTLYLDDVGSIVTGINSDGDVVGESHEPVEPLGVQSRAFLVKRRSDLSWDGEDMVDLGNLGSVHTSAQAVSDRDANGYVQVVGYSNDSKPGDDAFLWREDASGGTMIDLGKTIDARDTDLIQASSIAIDSSGQALIVGYMRVGKRRSSEVNGFLLTEEP